jgi:hypothetical protein
MKIISKKVVILFSAVLLLSVAAFSAMSLLFADEENGISEEGSVMKAAATTLEQGKTIIDYIIDNSNNTDPDIDPVYHILEIYSGTTESDLKAMVESGRFGTNVLDGNKSDAQTASFNASNIEYTGLNMKTADATLIAAINKADLIYFSEDPNALWAEDNDITEDVKIALMTYVTSDNKPLIFDCHSLTMQIKTQTSKTFGDLARDQFEPEGRKHKTNKWPSTMDAATFMTTSTQSAKFTPITDSAKRKTKYWIKSTAGTDTHTTTDATTADYIARTLIIQNGASDNALSTKFKAGFDGDYDLTDHTFTPTDKLDTTAPCLKLTAGSDMWTNLYGDTSNVRPTAMSFETIDVSNSTKLASIASLDLAEYDFVIIEAGTKNVDLSTASSVYDALAGAMRSKVHILYSSDGIAGGSSNNGHAEIEAKQIANLYSKIATPTDTALYDFVLLTARERMRFFNQATTGAGVKPIADIINAGSFRGIKTNSLGDSSNIYTVLEVEPCYPINTVLAQHLYQIKDVKDPIQPYNLEFIKQADRADAMEKQWKTTDKGFYYLRTNGVLSATSDEISFGDNIALTDLLNPPAGATYTLDSYISEANAANVVDYYNWSLSKAKIAHATGRDYNRLKVVHMSAAEFATSRKTLLDNYDAIYFGGDNSSIKPESKWYSTDLGGKVYTMYSHNGDTFDYLDKFNDKAGDYGVYSGNDLTASKLKELQTYAQKMPVIIDSKLSAAFLNASTNPDGQSLIDPQSNMFAFIKGVTEVTGGALSSTRANVLVNFDEGYTDKTDNSDQSYGDTVDAYATVFRGTDTVDYLGTDVTPDLIQHPVNEINLKEVLNATARPLLAVTEMPKVYSESDKTTWIELAPLLSSGKGLQWKVDVNVAGTENPEVNLYIDDDSSGRFESNEIVQSKKGKSVTLNFKPGADFYGVIYWKIEAKTSNGLSCSTTNVCKIKRVDQPKMYVNLLQIMPGRDLKKVAEGEMNNDLRTLYLCTDCQFAGVIQRGNPVAKEGMYTDKFVGRVNTFREGTPNGISFASTDNVVKALKKFEPTYTYKGTDFGSHTHDFGIVKYYDDLTLGTTTGWDDVSTNWFDIIRDDYDVDTTILYTDEYEDLIAEVSALYAGKSSETITKMIDDPNGYKDKYNEYYNLYQAMQALINGDFRKSDGGVDFDELNNAYPTTSSFTSLMAGVFSSSGMGTDYQAILKRYQNGSYEMDNVLSTKRDDICNNSDKATYDQMAEQIDRITDPEIKRDKRKYFNLYNNYNAPSSRVPADYTKYYNDWRDAKIFENFFFEMYQKYKLYASYDVTDGQLDLSNVYDCIAIGSADYFAHDDINEDGCDALLKYMDKNGEVILFHDSLNVNNDQTSVMTRKLSTAFGMNARHQKLSTDTVVDGAKDVEITIDGVKLPEKADMNGTVQSRTMTVQQVASTIDPAAYPLKIKVGDTEKTVSQLNNSHTGYNVKVTKKVTEVGVLNLYLCGVNNGNGGVNELTNNGISHPYVSIPANAKDVTISYSYNYWDNWSQKPQVKINSYDNTGSDHSITVHLDGNCAAVVALNSLSNVIRNDSNTVASNGSFTVQSSQVSSDTTSVVSYEIKDSDITTKAGTLSSNGLQQIDVTVVDEAGNKLEGEIVSYTVNGSEGSAGTNSEGIATFYRENYKVSGYTLVSNVKDADVTSSSGTTKDQVLNIIVLDVNGNKIANKSVKADYPSKPLTSNTDADGLVSFKTWNYTEATASNPTVVSEDSSKYPTSTYFMSKIKDGLSLSPRMLTYKGFMKEADKGQLDANKYTLTNKYTSLHSKSIECTVGGPLIAQISMQDNIKKGSESMPTDKTEQNNEGIITKYPFGIGDRMQISATAPGDYAVDIEDDDLIVYYSMVGGTQGTCSSLFAADPMDGINNYFIYQYGNVYYTGAGYSLITGYGRNNNDERRLYINIIVNAGRKSAKGPSLNLYDLDTTQDKVENGKANEIIKEYNGGDDCDYIMEIEDLTDFKGLDFLASIPASSQLKHVEIWWDVNHTANATNGHYDPDYPDAGDDIKILSHDRVVVDEDGDDIPDVDKTIDGNMLKPVKSGIDYMEDRADGITPAIALKDDCFDPDTGRQYAYLVVQVTDGKETASATLRIQYKPALIDLN